MKKNIEKKDIIKLNHVQECIFFEKNDVIIDNFCPKCGKILFTETTFCECGFFIKAGKNSAIWTIFLLTALSGIILLSGLFFIFQIHSHSIDKELNINEMNFSSVAPPDVQILADLKKTSYKNYIQNIYIKPKQKNTLVILIKPSIWNKLEKEEKDNILNFVNKKWKKIYSKKYPESKDKIKVYFGNSD